MVEPFSCKICYERYNESDRKPKIMPCGHTVCEKCTSDLFKVRLCKCPWCSKPVDMLSLKDNFEVLDAMSAQIRFWCENCQSVASQTCMDNHSFSSLEKVLIAKNISSTQESFTKKAEKEKILLTEMKNTLKRTLEAIQCSLVTRLEEELELCERRIGHLDDLSLKLKSVQDAVERDGDFSCLNVFKTFKNNKCCAFLEDQREALLQLFRNGHFTIHYSHGERKFTFGNSSEDMILKYLLSILFNPLPNLSQSEQSKTHSIVKTHWGPSPWVEMWRQFANENEASSKDGNSASTGNSTSGAAVSGNLEVYVCSTKSKKLSKTGLQDVFSQFGNITNIVVCPNKGKDIAFVKFDSSASVAKVLSDKKLLENQEGLQVNKRIVRKSNQHASLPNRVTDHQNENVPLESAPAQVSGSMSLQSETNQRMLFIQSMPLAFPEPRISEIFSRFGAVQDGRKVRRTKPDSARKYDSARAFGFVTFVFKESVEKALKEPVKKLPCGKGEWLEYRAYYNSKEESGQSAAEEMASTTDFQPSAPVLPTLSSTLIISGQASSGQAPGVASNVASRPMALTSFTSCSSHPVLPSNSSCMSSRSSPSMSPSVPVTVFSNPPSQAVKSSLLPLAHELPNVSAQHCSRRQDNKKFPSPSQKNQKDCNIQ